MGRSCRLYGTREHAPWALEDFGFRAIIASSFADIFYNNCFKNGLLPIVLPANVVEGLFKELSAGNRLTQSIWPGKKLLPQLALRLGLMWMNPANIAC